MIHDDAVAAEGHGARVRVHGRELRVRGVHGGEVRRMRARHPGEGERRRSLDGGLRDVDVTRKGV